MPSYTSKRSTEPYFELYARKFDSNPPGGRVIVDFGARCFYDTGIPISIVAGVFIKNAR
jgi:hypothetical protein